MAIIQSFTDTIATGASGTNGVDLAKGEFNNMSVVFPTTSPLTAAGDITAQTSHDGVTYVPVAYMLPTTTSTLVTLTFSRTSWGNNVLLPQLPIGRFFQLKFGTAATAAGTFKYYLRKD